LTVTPQRLFIVIQKGATGTVLNMDAKLANSGDDVAIIHRLEAQLTDPTQSSFRVGWSLFYEYDNPGVMQRSGSPTPLTMSPRSEQTIGIQFSAASSVDDYDWPTGEYRFDLLGWVSSLSDAQRPDFARRYPVLVDERASSSVREWATAPEKKWAHLNDPHNAIAIPVTIRDSQLHR
jgi:hypothetical protein